MREPQVIEIVQMYLDGIKIRDISLKFGISKMHVHRLIGEVRDRGIKIPRRNSEIMDWDKIVAHFESLSTSEVKEGE